MPFAAVANRKRFVSYEVPGEREIIALSEVIPQ